MNNSRRSFLKKLPLAMSLPFTIGGIPIKVMGDNSLSRLAKAAGDTPRVLVILQMAGGNDGLNNLIPVDAYDLYYSKRPNIAIPTKNKARGFIPLDSTLATNSQVGLHPDMQAMKALYDIGRMTVVQGVSYKNNDGSHFRGRDIAFMGGSADDYLQSGWLGRYLEGEYPTGNPAPDDFYKYPQDFLNPAISENTMIDPLALEFGNEQSLIFHQEGNIPTSISTDVGLNFAKDITDPDNPLEGFFETENVDPFGIPPAFLDGSPYFKELNWILDLEDKAKDYASRLLALYQLGGAGSASYPETYPFNAPSGSKRNGLAPQLKLVARLLAGGCKTKVFLVKMGGYDTHVDQVESYDPTMGGHAALLYHMSTAMKAFQEDLRARGLEDNVLTITTSEFGRRIYSNGSYGTDHGTGGPLYIFGKGVQPGVVGTVQQDWNAPNITQQYDYRVVYANIMRDWMLNDLDDAAATTRLNVIFPNSDVPGQGIMTGGTSDGVTFEPLPLAQQVITGVESFIGDRFSLEDCYPNPAKDKTTMHFKVNSSYQVNINLFDSQGRKSKALVDGIFTPGEHKVEIDLSDLAAGTYIYEMKTGFYKEAKKLIIQKKN